VKSPVSVVSVLPACMPSFTAVLSAITLAACGGGGEAPDDRAQTLGQGKSVVVVPGEPNVVSRWHEVAINTINNTINVPPPPIGATIEEQVGGPDIATVQIAVYDAAMAIAGTHKPFYVTPSTPAQDASMEAAINEAAYRVLSGLFPSRAAVYEPAYASELAAIVDGPAKTQGMALGAEVAQGVLDKRADDGRAAFLTLPAYVPGTVPGAFRGVNPVGRQNPFIKPFAVTSVDQFRPEPPPALTSERYALDFGEVQAMGGAISALRTPEQLDIARFHTDSPAVGQYRNQRRFATANASLADNARVLAIISVATADSGLGCFEAKYHYNRWRPQSAIPLADTDGNPATQADAGWTPVVTTPNHPEYPAGHGCGTGATVEVLRQFYGTKKVSFIWDSAVPSVIEKTRRYESTDELIREVIDARTHGGMHFRSATEAGAQLGRKTAQWVMRFHFEPR
jgi:hypothetical protein